MLDIAKLPSDISSAEIRDIASGQYACLLQNDRSKLASDERYMSEIRSFALDHDHDAVMSRWLEASETFKAKRQAYLETLDALKALHDEAVEEGR